MARKYPLSDVGCDGDALNVHIDVVSEIPRHPKLGSADAPEVAHNPRDDDVMSTDLSSDVDSDMKSRLEKTAFDGYNNQNDTNHIACAVSQSDDDYQLYTLVNGVSGVCEGTVSLEDIPSLSSLLEIEEVSFDE